MTNPTATARPNEDKKGPPAYRVLLSDESAERLAKLARALRSDMSTAGGRLRAALAERSYDLTDPDELLQALLDTKDPQYFAESQVYADGTDWTVEELSILGDVSVSVPVTVFDNGLHANPEIHEPRFPATLLYVPGALLRNDTGGPPADGAVLTDGALDADRYRALYERRLLPGLRAASDAAAGRGRQILVTIPGLGCGQFAGRLKGTLGSHLQDALIEILSRHASELQGIRAVWFDPYNECADHREQIGHMSFLVRPLRASDNPHPQLCRPHEYAEAGDDYSACDLVSVVAWDHVSWPGNDFYRGMRATDDGVKAAATDSMFAMTGVRGAYNRESNCYGQPQEYATWEQVVRRRNVRLSVA